MPTGLHGAISTGPKGNRVYFGHGTSSDGILQIDDRGYIYIVDRANTGMHILELTGEARKIANFK